MSIEITNDNFEDEVVQSEQLVVIDCYAEWCQPCKALRPLLLKLEEKHSNKVKLGFFNIEDSHSLAMRLKITTVPKVVFFHNGKEVTSISGLRPEGEYQQVIDSV